MPRFSARAPKTLALLHSPALANLQICLRPSRNGAPTRPAPAGSLLGPTTTGSGDAGGSAGSELLPRGGAISPGARRPLATVRAGAAGAVRTQHPTLPGLWEPCWLAALGRAVFQARCLSSWRALVTPPRAAALSRPPPSHCRPVRRLCSQSFESLVSPYYPHCSPAGIFCEQHFSELILPCLGSSRRPVVLAALQMAKEWDRAEPLPAATLGAARRCLAELVRGDICETDTKRLTVLVPVIQSLLSLGTPLGMGVQVRGSTASWQELSGNRRRLAWRLCTPRLGSGWGPGGTHTHQLRCWWGGMAGLVSEILAGPVPDFCPVRDRCPAAGPNGQPVLRVLPSEDQAAVVRQHYNLVGRAVAQAEFIQVLLPELARPPGRWRALRTTRCTAASVAPCAARSWGCTTRATPRSSWRRRCGPPWRSTM